MQKALIRLCYRKLIHIHATKPREKLVWEDAYHEFLLQAQYFNRKKKWSTFAELMQYATRAEKLHHLVSTAAIGYLHQLKGKVPDIVNNLGRCFLPFQNFRFRIVNSDVRDKSRHQVEVNFYTGQLVWHNTMGEQLLVSIPGDTEHEETRTEMFAMQP